MSCNCRDLNEIYTVDVYLATKVRRHKKSGVHFYLYGELFYSSHNIVPFNLTDNHIINLWSTFSFCLLTDGQRCPLQKIYKIFFKILLYTTTPYTHI